MSPTPPKQKATKRTSPASTAPTVAPERTALLSAMERTSFDAIITIDSNGIVLSYNPAAERLFGYSTEEVVGKNVKLLMPPHFRDEHDAYLQRYLRTGERRIIGIGRVVAGEKKDGSTFPIELSVGETEIDGAKIFVGFLRDLTEIHSEQRRVQELQRELFHVSRVGEMGQIASSLAHEVNQPLAAIANYLQASRQILTTQPQSEMLSAILEKAEAQANRAADIVKRLRAFMDRRDVERRRENVNKLIEEALALGVVGLPSRGTRILLQLAADLPDVTVDRVQIQQVIVNFIRNGVDALESAPRKELTISSMREGNGVRVEVADTGSGIAPGIASTLFKAFATTKAQGMGVGLSICKTIIESHGGHIGFRSRPDGGTIFHFMLPQVDGDSPVGQANG